MVLADRSFPDDLLAFSEHDNESHHVLPNFAAIIPHMHSNCRK